MAGGHDLPLILFSSPALLHITAISLSLDASLYLMQMAAALMASSSEPPYGIKHRGPGYSSTLSRSSPGTNNCEILSLSRAFLPTTTFIAGEKRRCRPILKNYMFTA